MAVVVVALAGCTMPPKPAQTASATPAAPASCKHDRDFGSTGSHIVDPSHCANGDVRFASGASFESSMRQTNQGGSPVSGAP
jgi:hypothetical protein